MSKNASAVIGIIVVIVIVVGGYAIFHKSSPKTVTTTTTSQSKAAAVNNSVLITKTSASLGQYLAEPNGQALYTYGGDSTGVSKVTGSLLASWPAYVDKGAATGLPTDVGTITRSDGTVQYTYKGMPLYTFVADTSGQVTGNEVSNFQIATPAAPAAAATPATPATPAGSSSNSSSSNYNY